MKTILVPTDFADYAENAFVYALRLADTIEAEVHLLYVIPPSSIDSSPFLIKPYAELLKSAKGRMQHFYHNGINIATPLLTKRPQVRTSVRGGDLKEIVMDNIEALACDLVVLGTKGRFDEWSSVFGSTTAHLIGKISCPVLVVPSAAKFVQPDRVVVGLAEESIPSDQVNASFDWMFGTKPGVFEYLHVNVDPSAPLEDTSAVTRTDAATDICVTTISSSDVVQGLLTYTEGQNIQLVIMQRSKKSWFQQLFRKSYTRQAVLDAEIPVLLF